MDDGPFEDLMPDKDKDKKPEPAATTDAGL
jgi:hypothetical protein